jgi:3-dehydroquinate synthase
MSHDHNPLSHPVFFEDETENHCRVFFDYHFKPDQSFFVLVDENTHHHCLNVLKEMLPRQYGLKIIEIPAGEENKTLETCKIIWEILSDKLAGRDSVMINLGGGVVTDIGGFAATVYKRGMRFINVPTSLMAMVDASIGGKTGVDFNGLKNQLGLFSQPMAVFVAPDFLHTLSRREMLNGFAEMLKHGLIADYQYFEELAKGSVESVNAEKIRISTEIKSDIVQRDPFEKELRKSLNFGHTIGHALETFSLLNEDDPLLHGEAILIGMMAETILSEKKGLIATPLSNEILSGLINYSANYNLDSDCIEAILNYIRHDKKSIEGVPGFALLSGKGQCATSMECSQSDIVSALQELNDILD